MPDLAATDLGRAFWAIALSLALWLVVQTEVNPERADTFYLDVEARNVPTGLVVTNEATWLQTQVRMSAPRDTFAQLRAGQLHAYVDLARVGPGDTRAPVVVPAPDPLVRVGEPNPRTLMVQLEELTRKSVPVRARLDGSLPFGYRAGRPSLNPETLTVTGPASFVRRVDAAQVEVRLDAVSTDIEARFQPSLVDGQGERVQTTMPGVELQPSTVRVHLPITQQVSYKEVGVHPSLRGAVPAGYWVERIAVDPAVVTVIGEPYLLSGLEVVPTEPVDLAGGTADFTRLVAVAVPEGLTLTRADPVAVSVQVASLTLRQTLRLPVTVQNVGEGLYLASEVPVVEITVAGPADQGLSGTEVQATVDAAGLGTGAIALAARVRLPERYELVDVRPASVRVVLAEPSAVVTVPAPVAPNDVATEDPEVAVEPPATPLPRSTETATILLPSATPPPSATPSAALTPTRTTTASPTRTPTPGPALGR